MRYFLFNIESFYLSDILILFEFYLTKVYNSGTKLNTEKFMPTSDFTSLLNETLKGNTKALKNWSVYSFNEQQIQQALNTLEGFISGDNTPEKSYALVLRAIMHRKGVGGPKDDVKAIKLYEEAIELGHAPAMVNRAFMHQHGQGGSTDYAKAIELYEDAIKLGNAAAMANRAFMHHQEQGGPKDYVKAIELYEDAIKLGNDFAMTNRAFMHHQGQGGPEDYAKAIKLYEEAIELGAAAAMAHRAFMHQHGQGDVV